MKMITNNDIIVVAPEQYRDIARKLSHEIAKKTRLNGAYWTIKQYEDNEFQLGAARYVILLGNSDENSLAKDYLPIIGKKLVNRSGACFGYDGSKAVVYGEGKLDQFQEFMNVIQELRDNPKTAGIIMVFSSMLGVLFLSGLVYSTWKALSNKNKRIRLLRSQTEIASTLFLTEAFDEMAGIKTKA